ncbi:MAG TPA: YciI family protein [Chitinophagaceae bacterium]|nr:YciI family protein [Chitinophagaceae bacterium]
MKSLLLAIACFCCMQLFSQESEKKKEYLGVLTLTEKFKDEKNWTEKEQSIVGEHFQRLVKMKEEGIVILAGRTELALNDPEMMGLVVFSAKDDKEALQFMMDDPAVKNKIMIAKVHPYGLALIKCE